MASETGPCVQTPAHMSEFFEIHVCAKFFFLIYHQLNGEGKHRHKPQEHYNVVYEVLIKKVPKAHWARVCTMDYDLSPLILR